MFTRDPFRATHSLDQAILGYANWLAPCTIKNNTQLVQAHLLGALASDSPQSLSLVLLPSFCYQRGQLWALTTSCMKLLSSQNLNCDQGFSVPFVERLDPRDTRPTTLQGRCLTLLGSAQDADSHWKDCALLVKAPAHHQSMPPQSEGLQGKNFPHVMQIRRSSLPRANQV